MDAMESPSVENGLGSRKTRTICKESGGQKTERDSFPPPEKPPNPSIISFYRRQAANSTEQENRLARPKAEEARYA
jgi:hypothetical protein